MRKTLSLVLLLIICQPANTIAYDPIKQLTGRSLHTHGQDLADSWDKFRHKPLEYPVHRLDEVLLESCAALTNAYMDTLENSARGRWKSLPARLLFQDIADLYPQANVSTVRYAENVDTIHGAAVTYGQDIFFPRIIDPMNNTDDMHWLLHELEHVQQYARRGSKSKLVCEYQAKSIGKMLQKKTINPHDWIDLEEAADYKAAVALVRLGMISSWTAAGPQDAGWFLGDYDGDGRTDLMREISGRCSSQVLLSKTVNGENRFVKNGCGTAAGSGDRKWIVADFDGNGTSDLMRSVGGRCSSEILLSSIRNGRVVFIKDSCGTPSGSGDKGWITGNFDGRPGDEIMRIKAGRCSSQVFFSSRSAGSGRKFDQARCFTSSGSGISGWSVGDFNGDGASDVIRQARGGCPANVLFSNGSSFASSACWSEESAGELGWLVGNFDGRGGDDIARQTSNGVEVFLSSGNSFVPQGLWTPAVARSEFGGWHIGDFDGDGRDDIMRVVPGVSSSNVFLSTGTGFSDRN